MISPNIRSLGFELECGIDVKELKHMKEWCVRNGVESRFQEGSDGSVHVSSKEYNGCELRFWNDSVKPIKDFLKECYEFGKVATNDSCGFHIHIKFRNGIESAFSYSRFYRRFIECYKEEYGNDSKYMERLENHFCRARYSESTIKSQLASRDKVGSRYNAINLNSINIYKTLEFRIFPHQQSYGECVKTIMWLIRTIEKLLTENKDKKIKYIDIDFNNMNKQDDIKEVEEIEFVKGE